MSTIAYGLRADVEDYLGGSINIGDGIALDVKEALDAGKGTIVADENDSELVAALDSYAPLKRVPADGKAKPIRRYDFMPAEALRAEAGRRGITGGGNASVGDLRKALAAQDRHVAAGDLAAANAVTLSSSSSAPTPATAGDAGSEA